MRVSLITKGLQNPICLSSLDDFSESKCKLNRPNFIFSYTYWLTLIHRYNGVLHLIPDFTNSITTYVIIRYPTPPLPQTPFCVHITPPYEIQTTYYYLFLYPNF